MNLVWDTSVSNRTFLGSLFPDLLCRLLRSLDLDFDFDLDLLDLYLFTLRTLAGGDTSPLPWLLILIITSC